MISRALKVFCPRATPAVSKAFSTSPKALLTAAMATTKTSPEGSPMDTSAQFTQASSYRSEWKTTKAVSLTRDHFLDLLYGKTPSIREDGFVSPEVAWQYEKELSAKLTPYKHNTGPLLQKVGVAQFEYQAQAQKDFASRSDGKYTPFYHLRIYADHTTEKDQYFLEARKWRTLHVDLAKKTGVNIWESIFSKIASLFPDWDVEIASEGAGRKYFSGIFRALNDATHLHCDWSPYDSLTEEWIINQVQNQVVFNLYLAPVKNGITTVHEVHWTEDVLPYRDPESYGYRRELVDGSRKSVVTPAAGALCFFNSRHMHEVAKVDVEPMPELGLTYRPRLTLSSFMGLLPSERTGGRPKLIFWS